MKHKGITLARPAVVADDGDTIVAVGRYIQGVALQAFEECGGQETFNKWAKNNYDTFATKFLTKLLPRAEVSAPQQKTVEDLLDELDNKLIDVTPEE